MELQEQAEFIGQYFPIASAQNNEYVRIALSIQAMIVAMDLKDGDRVLSARGFAALDVGTSTISKGMKYAGDVLEVTISRSGMRTFVAEGGRQKAERNLRQQVRDIDIFGAIKRANILGLQEPDLIKLVGEKWKEMNNG